ITPCNSHSNAYYAFIPWTLTPSAATLFPYTTLFRSITYNVAPTGLTINAKALTATGVSGTNKSYDGLNNDPITGTASLSGLVTRDRKSTHLNTSHYRISNADVCTSKPVTFAGYSVSG